MSSWLPREMRGLLICLLLPTAGCSAGPGAAPADGGEGDTAATTDRADGSGVADLVVGGDGASVSFAADVFPIVSLSCAMVGCHVAATMMNHWTNFSTVALTYDRWVNGPGFDFCVDPPAAMVTRILVVPGDVEASHLIAKLTSTRQTPCQDNHYPRMPPPQFPALSPRQIETIATWINQGAANN